MSLSGHFVEGAAAQLSYATFFPVAGSKVERGATNDAHATLFPAPEREHHSSRRSTELGGTFPGRVADHLTADLRFFFPDWSLEQATAAMVRGRFRHLVVVEGGELAGILSMRDIVRAWTDDGASCDVPEVASA